MQRALSRYHPFIHPLNHPSICLLNHSFYPLHPPIHFLYLYFISQTTISTLIAHKSECSYHLRSQNLVLLSALTELRKKTFMCSAPLTWNSLQKDFKLRELVSMLDFKSLLSMMINDSLSL